MELGTTARSTYVQTEDIEIMPHLIDGGGGGAAAELIQTTLNDFSKIAGKTPAEILTMSKDQRWYWYKKITAEEKAEAMGIIDISRRAKLSEIGKKQWKDPEYRASKSGENHPTKRPEVRANLIVAMNQPEVRANISKLAKKRWEDPEFKARLTGENHPSKRPEIRAKMSAAMNRPEVRAKISDALSGENNPSWQGGISFEPYCPKFNFDLKERVRNTYGRTCLSCGKSEIFNNARLSIHHLDGDKLQGCKGKKWALIPLCISCHSQLHGATEQKAIELEFLLAIKSEEYRRG